jgi:hypothetical protein
VVRTMDQEPHALQFVLGQDVDNDNVYYLHEEYASRTDHADTHSKTDHYKDCMEFFATEPFTEPLQADKFALLHDAPSEKIIPSSLSLSSGIFCVNAQLCVKSELRDEFLLILDNLKQHADDPDNEPLCIQFT